MQELNLFAIYTDLLNKHQIPYFVTGSVASIVYGDPRLTHDIDLVLNLNNVDAGLFKKIFPADKFYCPPEEIILTEINRSARGHFNLIHHDTGFKADIYLTGNEELQIWALSNCKQIDFDGSKLNIAPPEYVIIKKLEFFKEGNAQKHLSDIKSMLANSDELINFDLLNKMISEGGLQKEWESVNPGIR